MDIYLKKAKTFETYAHYNVIDYDCYFGTSTDAKGQFIVPAEIADCTGDWVVSQGRVWVVASSIPKDGKTTIRTADPVDFFNRKTFYNRDETYTTASAFIKDVIDNEWAEQTDSAYRYDYITTEVVSHKETIKETTTGGYNIDMVNGYITCNNDIGTVVDITVNSSSNDWQCKVIQVKSGDTLRITKGLSGSSPRAWATTDSQYKLIAKASPNASIGVTDIPITKDGYVILNTQSTQPTIYYHSTTREVDIDPVAWFEPKLEDDTYNLAEYIKTAVNGGLKVAFKLVETGLKITLSPNVRGRHNVSFKDGNAQLESAQFSSSKYSKVTIRRPEPQEETDEEETEETDEEEVQTYIDTTYYLAKDGSISESVPADRADGQWTIVVCREDDDPLEKATEVFEDNAFSYKVVFHSSRLYNHLDQVTLMLPSGNFVAFISEVSISSKDNRYHYTCGQMTTTISDTVKSVVSTISGEANIGNNTTALAAYPIGSIYMSANSISPSALFGGTWKQIQGRFLLGCSGDYVAGSMGGEAEHTLTIAEMPSHSHSGVGTGSGTTGKGTSSCSTSTGTAGGGKPHNNMPPYLSVYIWERIG